jgi:uncharacterized membrane protein
MSPGATPGRKGGLARTIGTLTLGLWALALGYLGFYAFGMVFGAIPSNRLLIATIIAVVVAVLFAIHSVRINRALRDHSDKEHDELMRDAHRQRQVRGF